MSCMETYIKMLILVQVTVSLVYYVVCSFEPRTQKRWMEGLCWWCVFRVFFHVYGLYATVTLFHWNNFHAHYLHSDLHEIIGNLNLKLKTASSYLCSTPTKICYVINNRSFKLYNIQLHTSVVSLVTVVCPSLLGYKFDRHSG